MAHQGGPAGCLERFARESRGQIITPLVRPGPDPFVIFPGKMSVVQAHLRDLEAGIERQVLQLKDVGINLGEKGEGLVNVLAGS